jgi:pSer/pThr/pTyr-binding forkhead associated (FHA) protein
MISIPELSVETHEEKIDHPVLVLEPLRPQSGLDPVILTLGRYTIGSSAGCEIVLNSHQISPRHCLIIAGKNQTVLKAWNSHTRINEAPVEEAVLHPSDRLTIGSIEFQVREVSQKKTFDQDAQTVGLESTVREVNGKHSDATPNRPGKLSESPFGSERFSRALVSVIENGQVPDSIPAQAVEHVQTQPTMDSVEQRLREREQELNRQNQGLEERITEFEKQRDKQKSLIQVKKRDLTDQREELEQEEVNLRTQAEVLQEQAEEIERR